MEAAGLLTSFNWLDAKLAATGDITLLLADYRQAALLLGGCTNAIASSFTGVRRGVQLSSHVLALEPSQLAFQIAGRLPQVTHTIHLL